MLSRLHHSLSDPSSVLFDEIRMPYCSFHMVNSIGKNIRQGLYTSCTSNGYWINGNRKAITNMIAFILVFQFKSIGYQLILSYLTVINRGKCKMARWRCLVRFTATYRYIITFNVKHTLTPRKGKLAFRSK